MVRVRVIGVCLIALVGTLCPRTADAAVTQLYYVSNHIGTVGGDGAGKYDDFITATYYSIGIAYSGTYLFWGNSGSGAGGAPAHIGRANADGTSPDGSFITLPTTYGVFAVAANTTHVYFGYPGVVGRAQVDGTGAAALFPTSGGKTPCDVEVDGQYVYWTLYNSTYIGRANLDGSSPDPTWLQVGTGVEPCGLALDSNYLYWTVRYANDAVGTTIGRTTIDGSLANLTNTYVTGTTFVYGSHPQGIAVDDAYLYWTEQRTYPGSNYIARINLDGTGKESGFISTPFIYSIETDGAPSGPPPPPPPAYQPDVLIRRAADASSIGDNVYDPTGGPSQTLTTRVRRGRTLTHQITLQNDGAEDSFTVTGCAPSRGFGVTYLIDGNDATAAVIAGVATGVVSSGGTRTFEMRIKVKRRGPRTFTCAVSAVSATTSATDAVVSTVKAKS